MTTNRDTYALAERVAQVTGRDAMRLLQWAACVARSDLAGKIAPVLEIALRRFECGQELPREFPDPVPTGQPVRLRSESKKADWL